MKFSRSLSKKVIRTVGVPIFLIGASVASTYWFATAKPFGSHLEQENDRALAPGQAAPEDRLSLPPSSEVPSMPNAADTEAPMGNGAGSGVTMPAAPENEEIREQAAQNSHDTPRAILDFAHGLSGMMVRAMESEEAAQEVLGELESCVNDTSGRTAVQARLICLANAKRLGEQYPDSLSARIKGLEQRHARLVGMLQATGL